MSNAAVAAVRKSRKPERVPFRIREGNTLVPFGTIAHSMLERRRYQNGDMVFCTVVKARHSGHWRLAHALSGMLVENCDDFKHLDSHTALKAVQLFSGAGCDLLQVCGEVVKIPRSLAYESMDQGEFNQVFTAMVRWIVDNVWPELTVEQVEHQAEMIGRE
jgi:hypothetical protein